MSTTTQAIYSRSLKHIIKTLEEADAQLKPSAIVQLIKEAGVKPEDLEPWQDFDHPVEDSYGRNLIYQGDNFELLTMSWNPGDFSTIHDHGHTVWGAVQIFGAAEHATFRYDDGYLTTLARWQVNPGDVLGVSHALIHQMGNPTNTPFVSLHVYGADQHFDEITGDARIFDLDNEEIQRHSGGVFFDLKPHQVNSISGGLESDYATQLRHRVELVRRMLKMNEAGFDNQEELTAALQRTFSTAQLPKLQAELEEYVDEKGHAQNSIYWKNLNNELKEAAALQAHVKQKEEVGDNFHEYAQMYDALICQPMLESFMADYLHHFKETYEPELAEKTIISLGVGTGLIEEFMINEMDIPYENIYGIDVSSAMVGEAAKRIKAEVGDVLTLDPDIKLWDVAYSGLNVFHYIGYEKLEEAITKTPFYR
jgi:cysteine dioxygenase